MSNNISEKAPSNGSIYFGSGEGPTSRGTAKNFDDKKKHGFPDGSYLIGYGDTLEHPTSRNPKDWERNLGK